MIEMTFCSNVAFSISSNSGRKDTLFFVRFDGFAFFVSSEIRRSILWGRGEPDNGAAKDGVGRGDNEEAFVGHVAGKVAQGDAAGAVTAWVSLRGEPLLSACRTVAENSHSCGRCRRCEAAGEGHRGVVARQNGPSVFDGHIGRRELNQRRASIGLDLGGLCLRAGPFARESLGTHHDKGDGRH